MQSTIKKMYHVLHLKKHLIFTQVTLRYSFQKKMIYINRSGKYNGFNSIMKNKNTLTRVDVDGGGIEDLRLTISEVKDSYCVKFSHKLEHSSILQLYVYSNVHMYLIHIHSAILMHTIYFRLVTRQSWTANKRDLS